MDRRLRVFHITRWYPPYGAAFVRKHIETTLQEVDPVILHCADRPQPRRRPWRVTPVTDPDITHAMPTYRCVAHRAPFGIREALFLAAAVDGFYRMQRRYGRPDLIHAHIYEAGAVAAFLAQRSGCPLVITEHFTGFGEDILAARHRRAAAWAFGRADRVITVSPALQRDIEQHGIRARFVNIFNPLDDLFWDIPLPARRPQDQDAPRRLIFIGRLDERGNKGVDILLDALHKMQTQRGRGHWTIEICGDGPRREAYAHQAKQLGIADACRFHGRVPKQEIATMLANADLLVSASYVETFSLVAAEALACGVPVVTTASGGPQAFVGEAQGAIVPPGDATALAAAIDTTLTRLERGDFDPQALRQYAHARFAAPRIGQQFLDLYRDVLAER